MRPQTKGTGPTDIFRVNAQQTPHDPGAFLHWRDDSDYIAVGRVLAARCTCFLISVGLRPEWVK